MTNEKRINPTKQVDLSTWINLKNDKYIENPDKSQNRITNDNENIKQKLSFGYGYNPEILKLGINKYKYSHSLENKLKLYEFEPKISYRIFKELANVMKYKCIGSELRKNDTIIKKDYFITDENPENILKDLNRAIHKLFELYDPVL